MNKKLYAVKNDEGKYWDFRDPGKFWELSSVFSSITNSKEQAELVAFENGGHVVTLIEASKPEVVSEKEAKMLATLMDGDLMPVCELSYFVRHAEQLPEKESIEREDRLMRAYVNGWEVEKDPKYLVWVKLPDTGAQFYKERLNGQPRWERRDKTDLLEASWYQFTKSEVEQLKSDYPYIEIKEVEE